MPNCNHPGASCVVGNFYVCKTAGCPNGPELPPIVARARPLPATGNWYSITAYGWWFRSDRRDQITSPQVGWCLALDLAGVPAPYAVKFTGRFDVNDLGVVTRVDHNSIHAEHLDLVDGIWTTVRVIS